MTDPQIPVYSNHDILAIAFRCVGQKRWKQAYALYSSIDLGEIKDTATKASIENQLGVCASELGQSTVALKHYKAAFALDATDSVIFQNLTYVLVNDGHYTDVIQRTTEALNRADISDQYKGIAYAMRGICYFELDLPYQALCDLSSALNYNFEDEDRRVAYDIGLILLSDGKYEPALPYFDKVPVESPLYAEATCAMGICHWKLGQSVDAERYLVEALAFAPDDLFIRRTVRDFMMCQKNWGEALVHAEYVLDCMIPTEDDYLENLRLKAICLRELGHLAAAETLLAEGLKMDPADYHVHSTMALVHCERGALADAHSHFMQAFEGAVAAKNTLFARGAVAYMIALARDLGDERSWMHYVAREDSLEVQAVSAPAP